MDKLYGLIGEKLSHTYSPEIHKEILKAININGQYTLHEVKKENIQYVIPGLKALGYSGINITIPYKTDLIPYLDSLSPESEKIRAINVVHIDDNGKSTGYNTDYYGFGMMLKYAGVKVHGETAVVLGTGGASRAVMQYLKDNSIKDVIIVTRNVQSAKLKYPNENIITYNNLSDIKNSSILINCTPVGMYPNTDASPIDLKYVKKFNSAIDLIYNPTDTILLREASREGLVTINGLYMLVAQAVKSHEIWNNIKISDSITNNIFDKLMLTYDKTL